MHVREFVCQTMQFCTREILRETYKLVTAKQISQNQ